jgi:hypothetical protein
MGMVFTMGNSGGIIASQVYRTEHAPRYLPGHGVTLGFCVVRDAAWLGFHGGIRNSVVLNPPRPPPSDGFHHGRHPLLWFEA